MAHGSTNQHSVVRLLKPLDEQHAGGAEGVAMGGKLFSQLGKAGIVPGLLERNGGKCENGQDCGLRLLPHSAL